MRKQDLVAAVAQETGISESKVSQAVTATFAAIEGALAKGDEVSISGFGTFKVTERPARDGRNPQTGETIKIAAKKSPTFKAGAGLKRAVE
ncbi:MAG: HU family DNA-binding protein [Thermomicrobiales bacterium]|jgi:DNA-binding protein HU-beta|nr:HU family DNA-binding protein [Thermomicrobiales bacterium]